MDFTRYLCQPPEISSTHLPIQSQLFLDQRSLSLYGIKDWAILPMPLHHLC
ncbi:hypothetical protein RchiOBHm_Chr7g0203991 [Rosa chinensis]|uniref:Uncharacterized protein n=1 Tax=Rosa chinensis TaxID=74649 RepID=A0A2P6P8M1_ROSCH|nr:hypothetical protein RchiOBHm_Chr7g0203991 [Rosa chinensis]